MKIVIGLAHCETRSEIRRALVKNKKIINTGFGTRETFSGHNNKTIRGPQTETKHRKIWIPIGTAAETKDGGFNEMK